ncbi:MULTISPECIES: IS481 family transposase [Leptospira]|uniref:Integrase catalytic domain-containing protein n=3 Tax=Leptospira santarosai TaxID=28183 RepID=K8YA12_9LEPT|nr:MULTISPECIES: IS481 family transposase [Leptospira]EKO33644.1 integrase core domain protein [Leptospira santarosai str. MOR084]EKO76946.1 integrase core domain protein [Leptospira sp. Fiocruz LV3954]EKR93801.1 integrase core domain protein [Leptospira santarosai str. CBC379]EKS08965.1 integrase core domain protein [Leptospira santarosai str. JET]EKT87347.1 hypothetical protein LSS_08224 [Leptospira santarosai serovar Shermani str. LT 821]
MEDIDHSKTKIRRPQSNGICERFHRTVQDEFYALLSGRRHTNSIEDLDRWIDSYHYERIKASIVLGEFR